MKMADLSSRPEFWKNNRGSVLIVAIILTSIIGLLLLPSYLMVSRSSVKLSHHAFAHNNATNLAESGLEHAMWSLQTSDAGAWDEWTISGRDATRTIGDDFEYGAGMTGTVQVYIADYLGATPQIVSKAIVRLSNGETSEKWVRANLTRQPGSNGNESEENPGEEVREPGGLFAYGLLSRDIITASGGTWIDSWESDPDNDPSTPPIPWSMSVRRANARVATTATSPTAIQLSGSAAIYGSVALGAGAVNSSAHPLSPAPWSTRIGPFDSPQWSPSGSGLSRIAPGALLTGFSASFETISAPTGATVQPNYKLPRQVSGPPYYLNAESIGTTGQSTFLQMNKLTVEGDATLTIKGNVTLVLPPSSAETIKVAGSGKILLEQGATLSIYTPGHINVSGAGIANPSAPKNVQIWGTATGTTTQNISLAGSGVLNAVVYAPNANFTLPGHTDFCGAAVVRQARLTGSGSFHYDESLAYFMGSVGDQGNENGEEGDSGDSSTGTTGMIGIVFYQELETPAQRAPYASKFDI